MMNPTTDFLVVNDCAAVSSMLMIWQSGCQLYSKIPVYVDQMVGSFSASLFDGDYKLVFLRGKGSWVDNSDTIYVQVRDSATVDVPVQPYYIVRNEQFQRREAGLTARCKVDPIASGKSLERVVLYVNTTQFVDANNNIGNAEVNGNVLADLSQELTINMNLPSNIANRTYMYARIGVKTAGVGEMLYSSVQKKQL